MQVAIPAEVHSLQTDKRSQDDESHCKNVSSNRTLGITSLKPSAHKFYSSKKYNLIGFMGITDQHKLITSYHIYVNTSCTLFKSASSKARAWILIRIFFDGEIIGPYRG
jgi:hypothetical protein